MADAVCSTCTVCRGFYQHRIANGKRQRFMFYYCHHMNVTKGREKGRYISCAKNGLWDKKKQVPAWCPINRPPK